MRRFLVLLLAWPGIAAALAQLDLDVRLDPATRELTASARLADAAGLRGFRLAPEFEIVALAIDGRAAKLSRRGAVVTLPRGTRQVDVRYRAMLKPLAALDHREVLADRSATAAPEGSFLPAAAGWYPDVGALFAYRVSLSLPAGQKGLVPGELVKEDEGADGYRAEFAFPQPAESIDLMAGPYVLAEHRLKLPSGRYVKVRTWFHPEIAELAPGYLDDSARYIERYSRLIGDYPFAMFSVVSSPTPTGFGMPSLTYLGREVLRLPFIRATSLGHEILHNWWGNGVYPDWRRGNWAEGLTTFLADYAYKEDEGEAAAREMRMGWLRDYAAVPPGEDFPLKDFTSRQHGIASIIGYNKAAMVFLMLRDRIGRDAFERGLQLFWQRHRFKTAGWAELETAFAEASGEPLRDFFRQWVQQPGSPPFAGADPDFRVWRRIDPAVFPPILREVFVAPQASVVLAGDEDELRVPALALAARLLDAKPDTVAATLPGRGPVLIVGKAGRLEAWLAAQELPPPPAMQVGSARVWAGRDRAGRAYAVVSVTDVAALKALARPLPHYGKQSWLVFDGPRATAKGVWPPGVEAAPVSAASPRR
ncbi:MAG: M1 family peptidase [Rhodocyclales bacterium]|nr:M1 family peptidase [Rhodocyclales bacterium]